MAQVVMQEQGQPAAAVKSLRVHARHRRRDPREVPGAGDQGAQLAHARAAELPALPARPADAGARLRPPAGRHHAAQARAAALRGRGGGRLLRALRRRADEVVQAPVDRSAGGVRHAVREVPAWRPLDGRSGVRGARGARDRDRAAADRGGDGRGARSTTLNDLEIPLARKLQPKLGEIQQLTPTIDALYVPNIDESLDEQDSKRAFWAAFRTLGEWYAAQPPY